MKIIFEQREILVLCCGIFYSVLCIYSIVTGLLYLRKGNVVNPLELPKSMAARMDDAGYMRRASVFFGWLTVVVGLVQGLSAYCLFFGSFPWQYGVALGFTIFSILSAGTKLVMTFHLFPILKEAAYIGIFAILLLDATRALFL